MIKVAFLDRDGALIFEPQDDYQIDSLEKLRILEGVTPGLKGLVDRGYRLVMVSNQNGVGLPCFPTKTFQIPQWCLLSMLAEEGIEFDEIFVCPHLPKDGCDCRKPKTGLLEAYFELNDIDREKSFIYGDRESDRGLAQNLGLRFFEAETNGPFAVPLNQL